MTHLYRGSPCVRSWSKYQQTIPTWTLCGIGPLAPSDQKRNRRTEDPSGVSCPYCRQLAGLPKLPRKSTQGESAVSSPAEELIDSI